MYLAAFTTFLLLIQSRRTAVAAATGITGAATAAALWNLAARRWPDRFGVSTAGFPGDFAEPLGYANAVGVICAVGLLLALLLPLVLPGRWRLVVAAAAVPLAAALAGAESRGALLALIFGFVVAVAVLTNLPGRALAGFLLAALAAVMVAARAESVEREAYWNVAADSARAHPLLGTGAGTWGRVWLRERDEPLSVVDAHSLPLEALAELGLVGVALLTVALAAPLVAAVRSRGDPLCAALAGGYTIFLLHAAVDWDWEMPAVTLTGLTCGAGLLALTPGKPMTLSGPGRQRLAIASGLLALIAAAALAGNVATSAAERALRAGEWSRAEQLAATATRLSFWAAEPWRLRGEAERAQGKPAAARTSFRHAVANDQGNPELWLALARVTQGAEHRSALGRARQLNPHGAAASRGPSVRVLSGRRRESDPARAGKGPGAQLRRRAVGLTRLVTSALRASIAFAAARVPAGRGCTTVD
jgi:O-antigen ligase